MASATTTENCSFSTSLDDLNGVEFSNIDTSILMCLLDDSQVEGGDDERLISVIQSLEAEIMTPSSFLETNYSECYQEDYVFSDVEQMDSCSTSSDHVYFEGIDMDVPYSLLTDDMTSYFIDQFVDEMENVVEFVALRDYSQVCCGVAMEEDHHYNGLWQEI
ncbi:hypothetical protein Salat_2012500 [Sesamum alatum]|uniref:Uncharacterized protein n=1 Tax=Sesamum alatum TaxID=300844 RepID=A0AAE2CFY1_9LAMI|nr:hypothetical protein Salat_2012500 [Sesamum alatum]